jgi:dihydroorotate dehydrogenase
LVTIGGFSMPDWTYHTLFKPLLFRLPPVKARAFTLGVMGGLAARPWGPSVIEFFGHMAPPKALQTESLGITFPTPVGLEAGLDRDGVGLAALARLGVGFVEIGPVTLSPVAPCGEAVRRYETAESLWYPDEPVGPGVAAWLRRLAAGGALPVPVGARLAWAPGASANAAAAERVGLIQRLAPHVAFFTLEPPDPTWREADWREHLALVTKAAAAEGRPVLLTLRPESEPPANVEGLAGFQISGGIPFKGGWLDGPGALPATTRLLAQLRERFGPTVPLIVGGVHEPADALALRAAGATLVQVGSGLVFSGPGLPKRINEAIVWEGRGRLGAVAEPGRPNSANPAPSRAGALMGTGWLFGVLFGAGVCLIGLLALLVALSSVVLPYDEAWVGLTRFQLHAINPRLLAFMAHDRVSVTGATAATGILFLALSWFGLWQGAHWARQTLLVAGLSGFLTFFLFIGFGYFDPLHALAVALLLPFYWGALRFHRNRPGPYAPPILRRDRTWLLGQWGQLVFIALGGAVLTTGLVIMGFGVTRVFVQTDLAYLQTLAESLHSVNSRLVPLIAHDRAGFGGALFTNGLTILLMALWGYRAGERWQWWALLLSGLPSYLMALWVHLAIGYTAFIHLLPVYIGMLMLGLGLLLSYRYLMGDPVGVPA